MRNTDNFIREFSSYYCRKDHERTDDMNVKPTERERSGRGSASMDFSRESERLRYETSHGIIADHRRMTASLRTKRRAVILGAALFAVIVLMVFSVKHSKANSDRLKALRAVQAAEQAEKAFSEKGSEEGEKAAAAAAPAPADDGAYTGLYMLDEETGIYSAEDENRDYPFASESGLFTGAPSKEYPGMTEIDYSGGKALVYSENVIKIENSKVLPMGVISQHTDYGEGESGCGAACLSMLLGADYDTLFEKSHEYADQGDLNSTYGGMTITAVQALCRDTYGKELENVYSESELPSVTVKRLIDEGKAVIALIKIQDSEINTNASMAHFIVINGYIEQDGELDFVYANSYRHDYDGLNLDHLDADMLDSVMNTEFDEPRTIAYIKD